MFALQKFILTHFTLHTYIITIGYIINIFLRTKHTKDIGLKNMACVSSGIIITSVEMFSWQQTNGLICCYHDSRSC